MTLNPVSIRFVLLAIALLTFFTVVAEEDDDIPRDESSSIEYRQPPAEKIDKYFNDEEFLYDKVPPPAETLWETIKRWFQKLFGKAFDFEGADLFWEIVQYLLIAAAIVGAVLLIVRAELGSLFSGKSVKVDKIGFEEFDEDIEGVDFDQLIRDAIEQKDYRRAVRLYYLKVLKELSDVELIAWKPQKTNLEYIDELRDTVLHQPFRDVSHLYEYTWYGNFGLSKGAFGSIAGRFKDFTDKLELQRA